MRMKSLAATFAAISLLTLSGCTTINASSTSSPLFVDTTAKLKADIQVGDRIEGSVRAVRILFFTFGYEKKFADGVNYNPGLNLMTFVHGPTEQLKSAAAYRAVNSSGADVIIAPKYTINQEDYLIFGTTDVKVEGFKGKIRSISQ